jgi:hypothetical protein
MRAVAYFLAGSGGLTLLLALSRGLAGRRRASLGHALLGALLIAGAALLWPVAANLGTYQALRPGAAVAQVFCERTGSRSHRLTLTRLPGGRMQVFEVAGDEWRMDTRTLAWRGLAVELGLGPVFRLDRLSTRYLSATGPGDASPSSYRLSDEVGEDVWAQARTGSRWSRYAVAEHAYGPWSPLAQRARYELWFDATGLHVRPVNEAASGALQPRP